MGLEQDTEHKPERGQAFRKRFSLEILFTLSIKKNVNHKENAGESAGHFSYVMQNELLQGGTTCCQSRRTHIQTLHTFHVEVGGIGRGNGPARLGAQPTANHSGNSVGDLTPHDPGSI